MNTFKFHLLLWLKRPSAVVAWLICTALALAFSWHLHQAANPPLAFSIAIVDRDGSAASEAFTTAVDQHALIEAQVLDAATARRRFEQGRLVALLEIPSGFFADIRGQKLQLTYRGYDGAAPALTDILAQGLMATIGEQHLTQATARYLSKDWIDTAKSHYAAYLEEHPTRFDARVSAVKSLKGLRGEVQQQVVFSANQSLGYGLMLLLLLLTRQQAYDSALQSATNERLKTIPGQWARSRFYQGLLDLALTAVPWSLLLINAAWLIGLKWPLALYLWGLGLLIFTGYRWLMSACYQRLNALGGLEQAEESVYIELLMVALIVAPGLLGGALFPVDWLPDAIKQALAWNPFYAFNQAFYAVVEGGAVNFLYLLMGLGVIALSMHKIALATFQK